MASTADGSMSIQTSSDESALSTPCWSSKTVSQANPLPVAFEPILSDEDQEIDPDRWCSHSA
jgi:hypothetical protein